MDTATLPIGASIHQIYITDDDENKLPPYFARTTETVRKYIPHTEYKIYTNGELLAWIL